MGIPPSDRSYPGCGLPRTLLPRRWVNKGYHSEGVDDPCYTATVREDFDRIADLSEQDRWDHNAHYHTFLLRQLPRRLGDALEIGCGTGAFARSLAERCDRVLAVDLSPLMVEVARSSSNVHPNLEELHRTVATNALEAKFDAS